MKNCIIHRQKIIPTLLIALALGCFSISSAVRAENDDEHDGPSIVGLWRVHYSGDLVLDSFDEWFPGGLEWESANLGLGVLCQGTFKYISTRTVKLFHVNWNYDANGALAGYSYEIQIDTLSQDGNSYQGTYDFKDYDVNGHFL